MPMGTMLGIWRAAARREQGFMTTVGLETFVDPRLGGGRLNERTDRGLGRDRRIPRRRVPVLPDAAHRRRDHPRVVRGRARQRVVRARSFRAGRVARALAAKNSGGQVIVEVDEIVAAGSLDPRKVEVTRPLGDAIVRAEISAMPRDSARVSVTKAPDWSYTGERRAAERRVELEVSPRTVIARRALRRFPTAPS